MPALRGSARRVLGPGNRRRATGVQGIRNSPAQSNDLRGSPLMALPTATQPVTLPSGSRIGRWRWVICALLFFATTINYIDRQVLGILAPDLQREIGWSELDYARIVIAFQLAYAVMMLAWGRILDKVGIKLGFAIAV